MKLFLDTSTLVKLFHHEIGSDELIKLIDNTEHEIWISELALIEFNCALFRKFRNQELNETQLKEAKTSFDESLPFFNIEPLSSIVIKEAEHLIFNFGMILGLRTLDAIQLATFSLLNENDWIFVCANSTLCSIASQIGFQIKNPISTTN